MAFGMHLVPMTTLQNILSLNLISVNPKITAIGWMHKWEQYQSDKTYLPQSNSYTIILNESPPLLGEFQRKVFSSEMSMDHQIG